MGDFEQRYVCSERILPSELTVSSLCALCGLCYLAIDFISNLKHTVNEMQREIDILRHEVESLRHGVPPPYAGGPPPPPGVMYAHGPPPVGVPSYPHPVLIILPYVSGPLNCIMHIPLSSHFESSLSNVSCFFGDPYVPSTGFLAFFRGYSVIQV